MGKLREEILEAKLFESEQRTIKALSRASDLKLKLDKMQLIRDNDKGAILTLTKFIKKLKDINDAVVDFDDIEELRNHIRRNSPI